MTCKCECKKCGYHIANFSREMMNQHVEIVKLKMELEMIKRIIIKEAKA